MPVVPADPAYRRNVVAWFLAAAVVGGVAIVWGLPALAAWLERQAPGHAVRAVQIVFALAFVPAIPMGLAMLRLSRRVRTSGQFPPPGMKVVVDTGSVTGDAAQRQARGFRVLGMALCLAGLIGMVVMPILVARIVGGR